MTIQDMKPGRELDALVAEKVMGFRFEVDKAKGVSRWVGYGAYGETHTPPMAWKKWSYKIPPYSTDISAAWEVWEHYRPKNWAMSLYFEDGKYTADIVETDDHDGYRYLAQVEASTAPEAMVKCRLMALEGYHETD